jgi:hypothetical protein
MRLDTWAVATTAAMRGRNAPPQAMLARLHAGREVGLTPASFAFHAVQAAPDVVARRIVQPEILDEWSIVWPALASMYSTY